MLWFFFQLRVKNRGRKWPTHTGQIWLQTTSNKVIAICHLRDYCINTWLFCFSWEMEGGRKPWSILPHELNQPELWGDHLALINKVLANQVPQAPRPCSWGHLPVGPCTWNPRKGNCIKKVTMTLRISMSLLSPFTSFPFGYPFRDQSRERLYSLSKLTSLSGRSVIKILQLTHKTKQSTQMMLLLLPLVITTETLQGLSSQISQL